MSAQPEALRLADLLKTSGLDPGSTVRKDAAAELRRLHAENEAQAARLRRAVEAWDSTEIDTDPVAAVIEAIRTYLTQKGATK